MEKKVIEGGYNPKKLLALKKLYKNMGERHFYYTHLKEIFGVYGSS